MAKELNSSNFSSEILEFQGGAVVDFWAPWCGPCRMMGPIIDSLATKLEGKIKVAKVNVDENQDLAQRYNVMSIPFIVFFKDGRAIHTQTGVVTEAVLEKEIETRLG